MDATIVDSAVGARKNSLLGPAVDRYDRAVAAAERHLENRYIWLAIFCGIFAFQYALIFTHHPWVDEWQALQIALETPSLESLLENLRYEGHPPLWYLLLRGLAWVVPTYWVLPVAAALCATVAQTVLLAASPFRRLERILIALSVFMTFEFMTISRGTSLGVALALVAVAQMRSRWVWVAISLLPLVDFMFGIISIILITLLVRDRRHRWNGLALWAICSVVSAWTVIPAADVVTANLVNYFAYDAHEWLERLGLLLFPLKMADGEIVWGEFLPFHLGLVFGPLFLWFGYRQFRADNWRLGAFAVFLALNFTFSVTIYPQHARHMMIIALVFYLLKWSERITVQTRNRTFELWLFGAAACGLLVGSINLARPFSNAHFAARYIVDHELQNKSWLVYPENRAQGISALTGIGFERAGQNCTQTLIRWNERTDFVDEKALTAYLRAKVKERGRFYFATNFPTTRLPKDLVRQFATFPGGYSRHPYFLSVVGESYPERSIVLPPCVPGLRPLVRPTIFSGS
jgi:hypothetical protein